MQPSRHRDEDDELPAWTFKLMLVAAIICVVLFAWIASTRSPGNVASRYGVTVGAVLAGALVGPAITVACLAVRSWLRRWRVRPE
jgi:hypothetical protein